MNRATRPTHAPTHHTPTFTPQVNFNDLANACVVLYVLMLTNNYNVIVSGFVRASGTRLTRYYFIANYVLGVVVILNIVVAYIINSYLLAWKRQNTMENADEIDIDDLKIKSTGRIKSSPSEDHDSGAGGSCDEGPGRLATAVVAAQG